MGGGAAGTAGWFSTGVVVPKLAVHDKRLLLVVLAARRDVLHAEL